MKKYDVIVTMFVIGHGKVRFVAASYDTFSAAKQFKDWYDKKFNDCSVIKEKQRAD